MKTFIIKTQYDTLRFITDDDVVMEANGDSGVYFHKNILDKDGGVSFDYNTLAVFHDVTSAFEESSDISRRKYSYADKMIAQEPADPVANWVSYLTYE